MAQGGDVIDMMNGWFWELIEWIIKMMCRIAVWLLKLCMTLTTKLLKSCITLIKALFNAIRKGRAKSPDTSISASDSSGRMQQHSFNDCISDIETAKDNYEGEELKKRYGYLFSNILLIMNMTIDEKCRLLEAVADKIREFLNNPVEASTFYIHYIEVSYKLLSEMLGDEATLVISDYNEYIQDVKTASLKPMSHYLGQIMGYVGALAANGRTFTIENSIFSKYRLPNWVE